VLGSLSDFALTYEDAILQAADKAAPEAVVKHGHAVQARLRATLSPFFLRRTKAQLQVGQNS
jgi:hypothetical protein